MKKIITGMLAIALFAGAAQAQDTTAHKDHHKGHKEMAAGKQLNLSEDQKAKIKSINEARKAEIEGINKMSLTTDQRNAKMKDVHQKYQGQMESVLTPEQKAQVKTTRSKAKGGKEFGKHGDANAKMESLNLTQDQKDRMSKMRESYKSQFEAIRNNKNLTEDQRKEQMKSVKEKQHQEMKTILTKEQVDKMESFKKEHKEKTTK